MGEGDLAERFRFITVFARVFKTFLGGLVAMPPEKFSKINVEIAYISAFLQAKI